MASKVFVILKKGVTKQDLRKNADESLQNKVVNLISQNYGKPRYIL